MPNLDSRRREALELIRDEHRSLSAVVHALQFLARRIAQGARPDMVLLGAIVHYLTQFPERLHHPAEDRFLFAPLRARTSEAAEILDALEEEHRGGDRRAAMLSAAMNHLAADTSGAVQDFVTTVDQYAQFYWGHMMREETLILPLAERFLDPQDWERAAAGFSANHDPMFGGDTARDFEALFSRIVRLAPPPIGLGSAEA